VEKVHRSLFT